MGRLPRYSMLEMAVSGREVQNRGAGQRVDERYMWFLNDGEVESLTPINGQGGEARVETLDVFFYLPF